MPNRNKPIDIIQLISPFSHLFAMTERRAFLIISRVQQLSRFFALMTLGWIVTDIIFLPKSLWGLLVLNRVLTSMAYTVLGFMRLTKKTCLATALFMLTGLFVITLIFLFFSILIFKDSVVNIISIPFASTYYFAPFVLAAGVGFFPLTFFEAFLLLATPIIASMFIYISMFNGTFVNEFGYQILWVLVLISITSAAASASQIGFLLELFKDSALDAMTGLYTRRMGEITLNQQFAAAKRAGTSFSVLFLDIDHFKEINDLFGHDAGDNVLKIISKELKRMLRQQDIAVRWGGDEILIGLPNTDKVQAEHLLQLLAKEGLGIRPDGNLVTASIGAAEIQGDQALSSLDLITLADNRLYAAKKNGRNCYNIHDTIHGWIGKSG